MFKESAVYGCMAQVKKIFYEGKVFTQELQNNAKKEFFVVFLRSNTHKTVNESNDCIYYRKNKK